YRYEVTRRKRTHPGQVEERPRNPSLVSQLPLHGLRLLEQSTCPGILPLVGDHYPQPKERHEASPFVAHLLIERQALRKPGMCLSKVSLQQSKPTQQVEGACNGSSISQLSTTHQILIA